VDSGCGSRPAVSDRLYTAKRKCSTRW